MDPRADELIRALELAPHPEGGFYKEIYRSSAAFKRPTDGALRAAMTVIYFLLPHGARSVFHRVRSDEAWHHLEGAPLDLYELAAGRGELVRLGKDFARGERMQHVVRADALQAAETTGAYTLVGCTVAPGFDFADFEIPSREALLAAHPERADWIRAFS